MSDFRLSWQCAQLLSERLTKSFKGSGEVAAAVVCALLSMIQLVDVRCYEMHRKEGFERVIYQAMRDKRLDAL